MNKQAVKEAIDKYAKAVAGYAAANWMHSEMNLSEEALDIAKIEEMEARAELFALLEIDE